jgi:hypothetical protein
MASLENLILEMSGKGGIQYKEQSHKRADYEVKIVQERE